MRQRTVPVLCKVCHRTFLVRDAYVAQRQTTCSPTCMRALRYSITCRDCGCTIQAKHPSQERCDGCRGVHVKKLKAARLQRWRNHNKQSTAEYNAAYHNGRYLGGLRDLILDRQSQHCLDCGAVERDGRGGRLAIHHLDSSATVSRDEGLNTPDNLVALCSGCHRRRHNAERKRQKELALR